MYKKWIVLLFLGTLLFSARGQQQFAEGMIRYAILVNSGSQQPGALDMMDGAYQLLTIKGTQTKTEVKSLLGTSITLHDARTGMAVLLNEYGDQKILIRMDAADFEDRNKKFADVRFELKPDTKKVIGYNCKLAIATLKDGSTFKVWYTPDLVIPNKNYAAEFRNLPGVPLEFESQMGKVKVTYVAEKLSMEAIPAATFDLPKTGYREMTYEEVKKFQRNGNQ